MNKMLEFLRKVKNDEKGLYWKEKDLVMENKLFIFMALFSLLLLITSWGRWLLKWFSYISVGLIVLSAFVLVYSNFQTLKTCLKHDEKLEKLGTSREKEEDARIALCEMEGDDGLPPQKVVYFADFGAMKHYADALYGCYLAQTFKAKYMQLPDDAILYTTKNELRKLRRCEVDVNDKTSPYNGYTSFIRANFHVVEPCYQSNEEVILETARRVQQENDAAVVIISTNEALNKLASEQGFEVVNPEEIHQESLE